MIALSAQEPKPTLDQPSPVAGAPEADDNMTPYRKLATETLQEFKSHDMPVAKKKAGELEVGWDTRKKALQKKFPYLWDKSTRPWMLSSSPCKTKLPDGS